MAAPTREELLAKLMSTTADADAATLKAAQAAKEVGQAQRRAQRLAEEAKAARDAADAAKAEFLKAK